MADKSQIPSTVLRENALRKAPWMVGVTQGSAAGAANVPVDSGGQVVNVAPPPDTVRTFENAVYNEFDFSNGLTLAADPKRIYLLIQNQGAGVMYFSTNSTGAFTSGLQIAAGGYYEPSVPPISQISVTGSGVILVGTLP